MVQRIAGKLAELGVPFCVCDSGGSASGWKPPVVTQVDQVVAVLAAMSGSTRE